MNQENPFGDELRRLRRTAGLTLKDLADEIGCTIVYVSDVERGRRNPPNPKKIQKLLARMDQEDKFAELLFLAARSRQSIEISVEDKTDDVASMLVALARRCDEGSLDDEMLRQLRDILEQEN